MSRGHIETNAQVSLSAFFPLLTDARSIIVEYTTSIGPSDRKRIEIVLARAENTSTGTVSTSQETSINLADYKALEIKEAQTMLRQLGYSFGPADGVSWRRTIEAIKNFQRAAGINPTGVVDVTTSEALIATGMKRSVAAD